MKFKTVLNFLRSFNDGLPLIKSVFTPLAKSVLVPLGITAAVTDAAIQKKIYGLGATLFSNEDLI